MIIAAAIKIGDLVLHLPKPARHADITRKLMACCKQGRSDWSFENETKGFLTDKGEFMTRYQAMRHARKCGQLLPRNQPADPVGAAPRVTKADELYSEDLW